MANQFTIVFSDRDEDDAIREVSLKIKSVFPKSIRHLFVFSTIGYQFSHVLKSLNFTLRPLTIIGIQSPFLIVEDKIFDKGISACVINDETIDLKEMPLSDNKSQTLESALRYSLRTFPGENRVLFSFLPPKFTPSNYIQALKLSLGNFFPFFGAGYIDKIGEQNYQMISNTSTNNAVNFLGRGLKFNHVKLSGFLPLGKPFEITRVMPERNIIMEINNQPAINIYKHYLEESFETFKKNHLFTLYPFGIKEGRTFRIVNILGYLEDGSLVCLGEVRKNLLGQIMLLDPDTLFGSIKKELSVFKKYNSGLIFMVNSLSRKKILKTQAQEELQMIKSVLGNNFKIIGLYADYCLSPYLKTKTINWEGSNLLMTLWD
ncbi:MAG: FIST C-terminal domain-containing protein [Candidatus Omnitrophica bacterium]|nr:FIST C-terminal domain-containing protein [Candidatus Omnitrophota bacterium]